MKKLLLVVGVILLLTTGCGQKMASTPRERVEEWMMNYQQREEGVVNELVDWLMDQDLEDEERTNYQSVLEKQYQNLSYEILSEEIDGNMATVVAEIEVLDYHTSMSNSRDYFLNHQEEFLETPVTEDEIDNQKELKSYQIEELGRVEDTTKYQITFELIQVNNDWQIKDVDTSTFLKMYGLY